MPFDCRKYLPGILFVAAVLSFRLSVKAQDKNSVPSYFWQIGKPDNDDRELALAPGRYADFKNDPFFVVGRSHENTDWTYCQPGPDDGWAGNRKHPFAVVFGVKEQPHDGVCRLAIKLLDIGRADIELVVSINGKPYPAHLPQGAARAIFGLADQGDKYAFNIEFPANLLKPGNNNITITTEKGSWLIYDWIGLECPPAIRAIPVSIAVSLAGTQQLSFISTHEGREYQLAGLSLVNTGAPASVTIRIKGLAPQPFRVPTGQALVELRLPVVTRDSSVEILLQKDHKDIGKETITLAPVPKMTIYVLPHSHNDIGYTEIQPAVEKKQINNLLTGIEYAKRTKNYPRDARFVWNLEGMYAADLYLQRMNEGQKKDFYEAVKDGSVAFNGMYLNTLTGLCRPEELLNLFSYSTRLSKLFQVTTDAAMISDVPGYTWGTVAAMNQAGIKYFSAAPNNFDRIGDILQQWEDKPFYWLSPSGKEKVLVWIPYRGYALSHGVSHPNANFVTSYMQRLKDVHFPYSISYMRWSGHGDNAVPDLEISDFVKDWNQKYTWPHFVISSTSKAFHAFEDRYGSQLPQFQGDWTGYWEDGAGSSAFETSENRASSSRLTQAETIYALTNAGGYPAAKFEDAWRHVILYSEHTWGADISVTDPLSQKTKEQWEIKKSYAATADRLSHELLAGATTGTGTALAGAIDVFNTNSWKRTALVLVPPQLSAAGDLVKDAAGRVIPSQRLSTGELALIATGLEPFSATRYHITSGKPAASTAVAAGANTLDNGILSVIIDPATGSLKSIRKHGIDNNFSDSASGNNLNDYLFLPGNDLKNLQRNGQVTIAVKEQGPVLSTLLITSTAPGCNKLTREIRLVKDFDYIEILNLLDKKPAELNPHPGDYAWANTGGKESVHFGFPFHVPDGDMQLDIPLAVMRPEKDQIPGSCKNWLETGSWADVSNKDLGITWATLDAPLVEVGDITATLLGGQSNPDIWRKKIEPTQKLYSWALNNHWETNYRAYQDGLITFRYALRPHGAYDPATATKFATGLSQPLIVAQATGNEKSAPRLQLGSDNIVALVLKPSEDGKAWILTLYNPTAATQSTSLRWLDPLKAVHYSNTGEMSLEPVRGDLSIAAQDVITLRVEKL